jgi:hypothetical protein
MPPFRSKGQGAGMVSVISTEVLLQSIRALPSLIPTTERVARYRVQYGEVINHTRLGEIQRPAYHTITLQSMQQFFCHTTLAGVCRKMVTSWGSRESLHL